MQRLATTTLSAVLALTGSADGFLSHSGRPSVFGRPSLFASTADVDKIPKVVEPTSDSECRLIILQITDVYTLENFASFKTLIEETKKQAKGAKVVSMLTGDFLSPYLLSKVDKGGE